MLQILLRSLLLIVCLSCAMGAKAQEKSNDIPPAVPAPSAVPPPVTNSAPPQSMLGRAANAAQNLASGASDTARDLINKGFSFLGIRYKYGGNSEITGFDCSGLVKRVFSDALGLNLPRTAAQMAKVGEAINKEDLKPGDLVFFNTVQRTTSHVGIYLGEDKFLHAPSSGGKVRVEKLDSGYWGGRYIGARRIFSELENKPANQSNAAGDTQDRSKEE